MLKLKRAYEPASKNDGMRILVDRLWPRGVSKEALKLYAWKKELAPSTALRVWFGHDPKRWDEFKKRYRAELRLRSDALNEIRRLCVGKTVTLVYGAKDGAHTHALVLKELVAR
jgi:uncharacterized protein YeaO (DUF488 family)